MRSSQWNRYGKAPAQLTLNQKIFNVLMAFVLVFTLIPVTSLTYTDEANAEPTVQQLSDEAAGNEGSSNDSSSQNGNSGQGNTGTSEGSQNGADSSEVQEGGSDNSDSTNTGSNGQSSQQGDSNQNANQTNNNQGSNNGSSNTTPSGNEGDQSGTSTPAETEGSDEADEQQRDPMAWQSNLDACEVSAELAIDANEIDELENNQLPSNIPATLKLQFELTPGKDFLLVDDWIELSLPSFLSSENTQFDVFRLNEDGTETTEKIADAKIENGTLKITFIEAAATEDEQAVVRGFVDVPVSMASSMLGEEESEQSWVVQTAQDGTERVIKLGLPTYNAVLDAWNSIHNPLGMLGSTLGLSNGEVTAQNAGERDATTDTTVTVAPGPFNYQVGSTITWCDNNYGKRPTPESLEDGFIPQYSLDGVNYNDLVDENGNVTQQAKEDLHLDDAAVYGIQNSDLIQITQTSVNTYEVLTAALPQELVTTTTERVYEDGAPAFNDDGSPKYETTTTSQSIRWQLRDTNEYPSYVDGESSTWNHQYKMLTSEVTFNVVGKTGNQALAEIFGEDDKEDFRFGASIDNEDKGNISVAQAIEEGLLVVEDTQDGCTITGTLPTYDEQGYPIVYYVKYEGAQEGDDYYQVSYNNSASSSHGSATDAVYNAGTMTLRHAGTTTYYGTKVWLDGDNTERPAATYTLWRYSLNGGSAATAAQVSLSTNETGSGASQASSSYVTVTIPEKSTANSVDLHDLLHDTYGEAINQLPKYDPDGYPYVYALREEAVPGYEQVFGVVGEDGSVEDQVPSYQNPEGTGWVYLEQTARPGNDRFVYNNGTISNRLTGTVEVDLTKTWEIAAFQDSLQNVVCTFQAQSRVKGSDDAWTNVASEEATQELTGWNAETLTKTVTETFPKYDAHGNELEYRWVETNVELEGQDTKFAANEDGTATFYIQVTDADGINETLEFTSTPQTSDDGTTTITNTFKNTTDQHVDKYWEQPEPDGSQAQIAPDPGYSDGNATIELYQDGVLIGTFTMDGQTDSNATSIQNLNGATWQETRSYHIDFLDLPKYSPEGKRYTYLVLETSKERWSTERSYNPDTRTTRIDNYFPEGEGSEIRITKSWLDGDDAGHRLKVEVQLQAKDHIESNAKDENGQPLYSYDAGDTVATVMLSSEEMWYAEVDVSIGGLSYSDFTAVETALIDDKGTEDTADDVRYPVVTKTEAENQYSGEPWVNAGWTNLENRRVATPEHVYEVKSQYNETLKSCEVTNRRLGLLDLTVTKSWGDALGDFTEDNASENPRPGATITLSCDENSQAFSLNDQGNLMVSVSGNTLPVTDSNGNPVKACIVDTDGNDAEKGNAVVEIDRNSQNSTYKFYGLPKYDANGMNVHYSVNEAWTSDSGDYSTTKEVGNYIVEEGARHFHDTQQIDFTNSRSGTRDVVFYKKWYDNYVSTTLNQRPDIYLTLYRMVEGSQPQPVDGYVHFSWSALAEDGDASNEQKVTISGMPKYDKNGNEYIYYATEQMSADGASLDYGAVQFDYGSIEEADASDNEVGSIVADADNAVKIGESVESEDPTSDGTGWAIREDGTFVNRLSSTLDAKGTKLWENIPGRFAQSDLPEMTIYLQRKLASEDAWPDMYLEKNEEGAWSVEEGGAVAETSTLTEVTNNQYTYEITTGYDGSELPRYDEYGNLYEYRAVEIIWGLYNQPGGFTDEKLDPDKDGKSINITGVREGSDESLTGAVYVVQHGETGSFLLRNVYGGEKGNLTVKKLFADRMAGDEYPDVTFDVYRYYVGEDGQSTPALAASHTLTNRDFKENSGTDGNNSATYTFEDLDVYAPDGSRWVYYVVEHSINGYTTKVAVGDITDVNDMSLGAGEPTNDGVRTPNLGIFDGEGNITESVIANDESVDVTFANTYEPDSVNLQGTKKWNDYNDIFSVRPDSSQIKLTFTRTAGGMSEEVEIQPNYEDEPNYFAWTQTDAGDWTFVLNNVEKWAPNGQAWTYTVSEAMGEDVGDNYTIVTGTSSVSAANTDASFSLENALNGKATVSKTWVDGGDPYGLRPSTVTVELQARYVGLDESGQPSGEYSQWQNAYEVWARFASPEDLLDQKFTKESTQRELSDDNGWRGSWTRLPVLARLSADEQLNAIEYRVVEVQIGDQGVTVSDADNPYGSVYPYQPSQTTDQTATGSSTAITNTLKTTKISATKSWADDNGDKWDTRPGNGTTWSVTYLLQRKLSTEGDESWQWLMEYGADQATTPLDGNIVSQTISGTGDSATATWENLPECDTDGISYDYRVVEQVPGSYDVTGGTPVTTAEQNGVTYRYYVVASSEGAGEGDSGSQAFTNELRTVGLTGTKLWEDFDTPLADDLTAEDMPQMTLYRSVGTGAGTNVTSYSGQPTWTEGENGAWTFTYSDLPAADQSDRPYTYWAEENVGTAEGFYPTYGTADAAGTATSGQDGSALDVQQGTGITNVATKLALDKVSDFNSEQLTNIELSVMSTDGKTTYAVWTNGADGETYNTYTWVNGTENPEGTSDAVHRTDNLIVGLKAGSYIVRETGTVPGGYAKAQDVNFTINANGTATTATGVSTSTVDGIHTINVTATDPVLRGHLQLTKRVSDDGTYDGANAAALVGAKFDLYRVDVDGDGNDELIASDLTTNSQGIITTVGNNAAISKTASAGAFDLTYGGKYTRLSDGLPEGTYYFVETDAGATAVTPSGTATKSTELVISQDTHYAYTGAPMSTTMGNEKFNATVVLHKYDTATNAGIENAQFSLSYTPDGASTSSSRTVATGTDGTLTLSNLEKGTYTLTEVSNTGYDMTNPFAATFVIDNDDDNMTFDIMKNGDGSAIDFKVTQGTFTDGSGIANTPLTGQVILNKRGNNASIDATFELQVKQGDDWKTVAGGLETSNSYSLTFGDDGITATATDTGDLNTGQLRVTGLTWNAYRFVETDTAAGYEPDNENGAITSSEFTIGRDTPNMSTGVTVQNSQTSLELNKKNELGQALQGAVFEVTPIDGSEFADGSTAAKTMTSDGTGHAVLTGQLVVGGTYEIYEAQGPTGYDPADATLRVHVERDGSLTVVDDQGQAADLPEGWERADVNGDGQIDNQFSFMATNNPMAIELEKTSADSSDAKLQGAVFRLTGHCMDNNSVHTYTTDENGEIGIDAGLLEGVQYTLTEVTSPAGYALMGDSLQFTMDERGEIVIENAEGTPAGWTVNGDKISLVAADNPVKLQITKRAPEGADGTPGKVLEGATFTITPVGESAFADGSRSAQELTTDGNGVVSSSAELVVGNQYDITETAAPEGYERVTGTMRIQVADDGTIQVVGSVENGQVTGNLAPDGYSRVGGNEFEVQVTNEPVEISIKKINAEDHAMSLSNATFKLEGRFAGDAVGTSRVQEVTSDENGTINISAQLVSGETYKLTETDAPDGYELNNVTLSFTVNENGTIAVDGNMPDGYTVEQGNVTIVAADTPIVVDFLKKDLGDTTTLAGGEFKLSGTFVNDKTHETSQQEITFTASENGFSFVNMNHDGATYSLVAGNTYTIEEITAPDGYELMDPFSFTVKDNGTIAAAEGSETATTGQEGFVISDSGGTVALTAHDTPIEVKLVKVSGEKYLSGAVFELYEGSSATSTPIGNPVTTGDDGSVALSDLVAGKTYTLHEVTAPQGYELLSDVSFTVSNKGDISLVNEVAGYSVATEGGIATITADDTPIEAKLVKVDASGNPLEGAVFTIANTEDSSDTKTFTTGNDGIATIDPAWLVAGRTYTVVEVEAPSGYELAGSATFTVGTDGTLSLVADDGTAAGSVLGAEGSGSYEVTIESGGVAVLTASDTPIAAQLIKADLNGGTLAGATFELAPVEGTTFSDGSTEARSVQMGEAGVVALEGLVAKGSYTLRETVAPAGYELNTTEFTFTVNEDGTVSANDQEGYMAVDRGGVVSVTATDAPIEIQLTKTDLGGNALDGAKFSIEGIFASEGGTSEGAITQRTFDVSADGATITGLIGGETYTITELEPPAGYKNAGSFSFTVGTDGTIAAAQGQQQAEEGTEGYSISADGLQMTVADAQIQAQLLKQSSTGEPLEGATFTIEGTFAGEYANETTVQVGPSNAEGIIAIPSAALIANNTYTLTEVTAPQGYELAGSVEFSVGTDGTISLTGTTEEGSAVAGTNGTGTYTASATEGTAVITATDHLVELTITKTDGENALLPGAEFTATEVLPEGQTGNPHVVSGTTDENGSLVLTGLIAGKQYTLTETKAPAGYELLTDELTFTVNSDGTIDAGWFPPAAFGVEQDAVSVTDDKLLVTMLKQDPNGNPLAGAEFTIEGEFPDGDTSKLFTSNNEGIVFEDTQFTGSAEGTRYVVTETSAPEGFELPQGSFEMLVYEDGTLEIVGDSGLAQAAEVSETGGTAVVTVNNEPLPGTELIKTSDILSSLVAGALGLLGLTAIVTATVARRVLRRKE